jgi:CubicO group peptidase (beta-lactamase class C family)
VTFEVAARLLQAGVDDHTYPAAVVEVGRTGSVLWREAFGRLTYEPEAAPAHEHTVFDLASLTKVIATTTITLGLIERGRLSPADKVADWLARWRGHDRTHVTVRDLLEHCAGLTGWLPFYRDHEGRSQFESGVIDLPLEYEPWTQSVYSDLGFILLAFILEDAGGATLDRQFHDVIGELELRFRPPPGWRDRTAPTANDTWRGRLLVGEVHDENAWALGGVAGHAGVFGTAPAVGAFARLVLTTLNRPTVLGRPDTLVRFLTRSTVPRSSRALGWDRMLPTSSCGTRMSETAFGHTGFTGTSLWIDPARDLYVVLLTNRVYSSPTNDRFLAVRPALHDAILEALGP